MPRNSGSAAMGASEEVKASGDNKPGPFDAIIRRFTADELDPKNIPSRPWLLGSTLLNSQCTGIIGPGGIGKSLFLLTVLLAIVAGRGQTLLDEPVLANGPCWYITSEEDVDEVRRQVAAIVHYHGLDPQLVAERLHITTTEEEPFYLAATGLDQDSPREMRPTLNVEATIAAIKRRGILVTAFDPYADFAKGLREIDNDMMNTIGRLFVRIARQTKSAVMIAEHVAKSADDPTALYYGRGGGGLTNKLKINIHLAAMSPDEARSFGLKARDAPYWLGRYDGKTRFKVRGYAATTWFERKPFDLGQGDIMGVLVPRKLERSPDITRAKADTLLDDIAKRFKAGPERAFTLARNSERSLMKHLIKRMRFTKGAAERVVDAFEANEIIGEAKMKRSASGNYPKGIKVLKRFKVWPLPGLNEEEEDT